MNELIRIAAHFIPEEQIGEISPLGNGLINDTFKVFLKGENKPKYVLQRINNAVFTDVEMLQNNIETVTRHIRQKYENQGVEDISRRVLHFLKADMGKTYIVENEKYWRMMGFVSDSFTYETVTPEYAYYAGLTFGDFESLLADLKEPIGEIIPDFHNIEFRLKQLDEAVANDKAGRMKDEEVQKYVSQIQQFAEQMTLGERLYREGKLPKRICHCDTKVNNMLLMRKATFCVSSIWIRSCRVLSYPISAISCVRQPIRVLRMMTILRMSRSTWRFSRHLLKAMSKEPSLSYCQLKKKIFRMPRCCFHTCRPCVSLPITSMATPIIK